MVVKVREYGSVRCIVLNGSKGSFSLVITLSSISLFISTDILDFFQNCFYTIFVISSRETSVMPRSESSSAVSQGYFVFSHLSSWFPHRFEFEDHTIPWFCPKLSFLI